MKKPSTFKILISEFNKLEINTKFTVNEFMDNLNNKLKEYDSSISEKNLRNYLFKMYKSNYTSKINDENIYVKLKNLPTENFNSIDLEIQSRVVYKNN